MTGSVWLAAQLADYRVKIRHALFWFSESKECSETGWMVQNMLRSNPTITQLGLRL